MLHLCWDNFDLNEETPSGAGTTHSTHRTVLQEVSGDENPADLDQQDIETEALGGTDGSNTKEKTWPVIYMPQELEPCFLKNKVPPQLKAT